MTVFVALVIVIALLFCSEWVAMTTASTCGLTVTPLRVSALLPMLVALLLATIVATRDAGAPIRAAAFATSAVAAQTDMQTGYVFDRVLLLDGVALVVLTVFVGDLRTAIAGAIVGAGLLLIPWIVTHGRGIGLGDVKLAGVLGFALAVPAVFSALWFAAVSGGFAALLLLVSRRASRKSELRFAPFLALGFGFAAVSAWH
jgi:prepilin signal peptidase PulO-like enzyme (type II secretory pathway)